MKIFKKLVPAISLLAVLGTGSMVAHADEMMDSSKAYDSAVKQRLVHYKCDGNSQLKVTYGFNKANLPTYAQASLNGKQRFMPINLKLSDDVDTLFGDENNFSLGTSHFTLANYHKLPVQVQSPSSEILYKNCNVAWVKKLKG